MICTGCGHDCVVTVTFRDAHGAIQTRCVRCGGAESGPDVPDRPVPRRPQGKRR